MSIEQYPTHGVYRDGVLEQHTSTPEAYADSEFDVVPLPANYWLDTERARRWSLVKVERDALLAGGCEVSGIGTVQTTAASLAAIDRLVTAALTDPAGWSDVFTLADNSDEPVGHAEILAIKAAVVAHEQAVRAAARDVRDELFDGDVVTLAQLQAVPVNLAERLT